VPVELVKNVRLTHISPNAIGNRSLPSPLEKIAVGLVVETVNTLRNIRTRMCGTLRIYCDLGVSATHVTDHRRRRIVVGEFVISPIVLEHLVNTPNEGYEIRIVVEVSIHHAHKYAQVL